MELAQYHSPLAPEDSSLVELVELVQLVELVELVKLVEPVEPVAGLLMAVEIVLPVLEPRP